MANLKIKSRMDSNLHPISKQQAAFLLKFFQIMREKSVFIKINWTANHRYWFELLRGYTGFTPITYVQSPFNKVLRWDLFMTQNLKSVNLWYIHAWLLGWWYKWIVDQVSDVPSIIFFMISCKILCKKAFNSFYYFFL